MNKNVNELNTNHVQSNLYERLKDDFISNKQESVLYTYLFNNYEKKAPRSDGKIENNIRCIINHIRVVAKQDNYSSLEDLNDLHKKLTIFENSPNSFENLNAKILQSYANKNGYSYNSNFPFILRYLNYKIEHLKSTQKKIISNISGKKKADLENTNISKDELLSLLDYYERCDTFSRCYDFLFRLKNKENSSNPYLQLIQHLYEYGQITSYDLFSSIQLKSMAGIIDIINTFWDKNKPFFIPLITDPKSNTSLIMIRETKEQYSYRSKYEMDRSLDYKMLTAETKTYNTSSTSQLLCTLNIYYWHHRYIKGQNQLFPSLKYRFNLINDSSQNIDEKFKSCCEESFEAIQKYNIALTGEPNIGKISDYVCKYLDDIDELDKERHRKYYQDIEANKQTLNIQTLVFSSR